MPRPRIHPEGECVPLTLSLPLGLREEIKRIAEQQHSTPTKLLLPWLRDIVTTLKSDTDV
jgi:hypothetical protein